MRITFLGTGTSHGVPMIGCDCETCRSTDPRDTRLRPSILVETGADHRAAGHVDHADHGAAEYADRPGTTVLVDAGPDLRAQALRHGIRRIDAILFTHGHADHILGIDDLRRFNALMKGPMPCHADPRTLDDIRKTFHYVFDPATPRGGGLPSLELLRIEGPLRIGDLDVQPIPLWHGERAILGFRFDRFAYLTDCNGLPDESWGLLEGLDVVVLDALREPPHPTHFSLSEAVEAARRIGAGRTLFTHMCHHLQHEPTNARLPAGMALAHDGLVLEMADVKC